MGGMIDCFLYNPDNYLIDYDVESSNTCTLEFKSNKEGKHLLKIKNYSSSPSNVIIKTN